MNRSSAAVVEQAEAYASLFDRASASGRFDEASSDGPVRLASDQELLEATASVTRLIRLAEAERVKLAGEIARRSEVSDESSLAKRMGATNAADLVAQVAGVPREEAGAVVRLATAVRSQEGLSGEPLPAKRACIADALAHGRLDLTVASAMVRALRKSEPGLTPYEVDELERQLVDRAQEGCTADELLAFLRQVPSSAHPEGQDSRDEELAAAASVSKRKLDNGLTRWILDLDPLTNGFFETALDANTSIRRFAIVDSDALPDPVADQDRRPLNRRRVDGVRLVAKRALKSDDGQQAGTALTLVVTMTEEALRTGLGVAGLPGCMDTIAASTARMLAAEAEVVPVVLGGKSQPLDLGTSRRFFSEAQRRAMAVRAGGCEGPSCDAPLAWCDAAHLKPAGWGPTSVDNGLLLCWRCHLLLDEHGWQVRREGERWWWTPPPWVDSTGRRRPGGRVPPLDLSA
jgi:5-methylcytosine-specific restriction protein A